MLNYPPLENTAKAENRYVLAMLAKGPDDCDGLIR